MAGRLAGRVALVTGGGGGIGMATGLAVEEAAHGIRVNAVCPGGTITPYHIRRAAECGVSEQALRASRSGDNLLGRSPSRARSRTPSCSCRAPNPPSSPARRSWSMPDVRSSERNDVSV